MVVEIALGILLFFVILYSLPLLIAVAGYLISIAAGIGLIVLVFYLFKEYTNGVLIILGILGLISAVVFFSNKKENNKADKEIPDKEELENKVEIEENLEENYLEELDSSVQNLKDKLNQSLNKLEEDWKKVSQNQLEIIEQRVHLLDSTKVESDIESILEKTYYWRDRQDRQDRYAMPSYLQEFISFEKRQIGELKEFKTLSYDKEKVNTEKYKLTYSIFFLQSNIEINLYDEDTEHYQKSRFLELLRNDELLMTCSVIDKRLKLYDYTLDLKREIHSDLYLKNIDWVNDVKEILVHIEHAEKLNELSEKNKHNEHILKKYSSD